MTGPRHSLRRLLLVGAIVYGTIASGMLLAFSVSSNVLRRALDASNGALREEQHIADRIVVTAYGQQLAALRHIHDPSPASLADFRKLGVEAYGEIRKYLFRNLPPASRARIERINEVHQEFEVAAARAFELAGRGDERRLMEYVARLNERGAELEHAVRAFTTERETQGMLERARIEHNLHQLQLALFACAVLLALGAIVFAEMIRRRVMLPLRDLSDALRRLGDGSDAVRVAPQQHAEFKDLALSFDRMAQRIRASQSEIESRNAALTSAMRDLQRAQQELVQREKLSAMGEMLAGLAHELNNPLAGVLGMAELLQADASASTDPKVRRLAADLVDPLVGEARRSRELVRNLLHFSRASSGEPAVVRLTESVEVAVGLCRHRFAQQCHHIDIQVDPQLHVTAQPQKLEHAVINVVSNALQALESGQGTGLTIRSERDGESALLHFEDDGPGFQDVDRAFDPFYTTKAVGQGTGLGLSLVHRFVTEFGGSVSGGNRPGGGAIVTLTLRIAQPDSEQPQGATPEARPSEPGPAPNQHVLVADDEPAIREVQRRLLERMGLRCSLVANGMEAIAALKGGRYDLVITDLRMPGDVSGYDVLDWLSRERPRLAATALVVTGDLSADAPGSSLPKDRTLTKPFQRDEYEAKVRQVLSAEPVLTM